MSGIVALFSGVEPPDLAAGRAMFHALPRARLDTAPDRAGEPGRRSLRHDGHALLGVTREEWEYGDDFSGPVGVLVEGDLSVAADASLYHRDDLRQRLAERGASLGGATASHLILAAYRTWGDRCTDWLEGDFAFVIWDARRRTAICARDFIGRRPLYFARCGDSLVVASTIRERARPPRMLA